MNNKVDKLTNLFNDAVAEGVFPGANVVIVNDKETVIASFGKKAVEPIEEENDIDTLYDMASCSKVVSTTTSILLLLEQGKIKLHDEVNSYLPRFKHKGITLFHLLTHTSGLPADVVKAYELKSREELIDIIYDMDLIYETGSEIKYSDIGFIFLGFIIEEVSGLSLEQFAGKYIFDELEMESTCYNPIDKNRCAPTELRNDNVVANTIIRGNVHDEKAFIMGGVAGHAGLFSCVKDLQKFIKMILNRGVYRGKQFLSPATIDLIFTPMVKIPNKNYLRYDQRGIGWIVADGNCSAGDIASLETISHTGFTGTNIVIDRVNKVGFAILSNRVHVTRANEKILPWRGKIANFIVANFNSKNIK